MIHHKGTYRDNQARHIRNDHHQDVEKLTPLMKKTLKFTARATWFMMKTLVRTAFRIPRLFSKTAPRPQRKKFPSPATAFPAP